MSANSIDSVDSIEFNSEKLECSVEVDVKMIILIKSGSPEVRYTSQVILKS